MRTSIVLVRNTPPFSPIREIVTAVDVDRLKPLDEPGQMTFRVATTEGECYTEINGAQALQNGSPLPDDLIVEGAAVVDYSSEGIPPWLWAIRRVSYASDGYVDVECVEWRALTADRLIPLAVSQASRSASAVGRQLLQAANGRNPTFIAAMEFVGGQSLVLGPEPLQLGGKTLQSALDDVALRTDSEWWVEYPGTWATMQPVMKWSRRRGRDLSSSVQLTEGVHLTGISYSRDGREVPRVVRFINSIDGDAGAIATTPGGLTTGPGDGRIEPAPARDRRRALRSSHGPAVQVERLEVLPQGSGEAALINAALRRVQLPVIALQSVELTLRPAPRLAVTDAGATIVAARQPLWSQFFLGDTILVRLATPVFLAGVDLTVRVMAIQPDEATGEMVIVAEVQA